MAELPLTHEPWPHPKGPYGELADGSRPVGRPRLSYKDICKRDMKLTMLTSGRVTCMRMIVPNGEQQLKKV